MNPFKIILLELFVSVVTLQAGGVADLVGQKSKTKDYEYSWDTEYYFVKECSQDANEWICKCVLKKVQYQYSEADFLNINYELNEGIEHLEFVNFISSAVDQCDAEYAKSSNNPKAEYYDLMEHQNYSKDIDKVLSVVADLQTTGRTFRGDQHNRANDDYNEEQRSDVIGDGLAGLLGGGIATKAKGSIRIPSEREIKLESEYGYRSTSDIMIVVRQRIAGLRHIYNKFLKKKPGFEGVVSLRLAITHKGYVSDISIVSSTTGYRVFDKEIKNAVSYWKFGKVQAGNTIVTIPFPFDE